MRFKLHGVVRIISRKCGGCQAEVDALVDGQIRFWINPVFPQDELEDHFRHAACPASKHGLSFQLIPCKAVVRRAGDQKVSRPLCKLGKVYGIVLRTLLVDVNAGLGAHKADVGVPGNQRSHDLVGPASVHKGQVNALLLKIPQLNGCVLGGIEDRMGNFI